MNKPILLLQFRTDKSRGHEVEQILKKGGFKKEEIKVVNILDRRYRIPGPKDLDNYSAVITGASGQFNVTDWPDWIRERIEKLYPLFKEIIRKDVPTLAICFGHQIVAQLLGGKVETDVNQQETGTFEITITSEGTKSQLFKGIPKKFTAVVGHKDSVTKLPKGAIKLAYSDKCNFQSYRIGKNFYSTQFHPELDRDGLTWRICLYPVYMHGKSFEEVKNTYRPIPHASKVVSNFRKIVNFNRD